MQLLLLQNKVISFESAVNILKLHVRFSDLSEEKKTHWNNVLHSFNKETGIDSSIAKNMEQGLTTRTACYHSLKTLQRKRMRNSSLNSMDTKRFRNLVVKTSERINRGEFTQKDLRPTLTPLYSILSDKESPAGTVKRKSFHRQLLCSLIKLDKKQPPQPQTTPHPDMALELEKVLQQIKPQ